MNHTATARAGPWPTHDERLLLRSALLDGEAAIDAWRLFRATHAGIDHLEGDAYGLLPQLFTNLQALDIEDAALGRMKGIYRHTWYVNQLLMQAGSQALERLQTSGVETLLLGGGALIAHRVRDAGARPMDAIDILVRPADVEGTLRVLGTQGWIGGQGSSPKALMRTRPALGLFKGSHCRLILHWSELFPDGCDSELWDAAVTVSLGGVETLAPSLGDQLTLACVQGLGWTPAPLEWIPDAALLVRSATDHIDWQNLVLRAHQREVTLDLADALEFLVAEFQLQLPGELPSCLRRRARAGERLVHRIKMAPHTHAPLSTVLRRTARACETTRRLVTAPPLAACSPRAKVSLLLDEWGWRACRAVSRRAARKGVGWFRRSSSPVTPAS